MNKILSLINIFVELHELSMTENIFFSLEGYITDKKSGMAMGSSLSPICLKVFMEYFETELLPNITQKKWRRYVDDIFYLMAW